MGPGRSSSLRIGGDSPAVSGGGGGGGGGSFFETLRGNPLFPWKRVRGKLMRLNTLGDQNIRNQPCRMLWRWDLAESSLCMGPLSRGVIGPLLVSKSGLPIF